MFFLLYVPTIRRRLSDDEMNRLSEHFADQLLAQGAFGEGSGADVSQLPDELRPGIKEQVLAMMNAIQAGWVEDDNSERKAETAPLDVMDSKEIVHVKDFLERCYKQSA